MRIITAADHAVVARAQAVLEQTPHYQSGTDWQIVYATSGGPDGPVARALSEDGCWLAFRPDAGPDSAEEITPSGALYAYGAMFDEIARGADVAIPDKATHASIWNVIAQGAASASGHGPAIRTYLDACAASGIDLATIRKHGYDGPDVAAWTFPGN